MLVLSRLRDETILIGDEIEITVVDIRGDKVRLGITAPASVPVHRKEVYDAIQRDAAVNAKANDLPERVPKRKRLDCKRPWCGVKDLCVECAQASSQEGS